MALLPSWALLPVAVLRASPSGNPLFDWAAQVVRATEGCPASVQTLARSLSRQQPAEGWDGMWGLGTPRVSGPRVWRPSPLQGKVASVWKQDTVAGRVVPSGSVPLWKGFPSTLTTMWGREGS